MSLETLVIARSQIVIRTEIYTSLADDGVTIEGLQEDALLRALPEVFADLEAQGEAARVSLTYAAFPSGAVQLTTQPGWMVLHASDFFQITRDPSLSTLGQMRVTATAGASGSTIATGDLVVRYGAGSAQILYTNTEGFTPIPGSFVDVAMSAQVAGTTGNIGNNATLALVTAYPGLSVTNPPVSGTQTWITRRGRDEEALVSLKDRCDARWADLSDDAPSERFMKMIRKAFEAIEETNPITRIHVDDSNPDGPGSVWVYMARDSAPATADDVILVDEYVTPRWAAGHGPFASFAATVLTITVSGSIKGPLSSSTALTQASAALAALAPTYSIGGDTVFVHQIERALGNGVTGAKNVVIDGIDTPIPPGTIVEFAIGTIAVTP